MRPTGWWPGGATWRHRWCSGRASYSGRRPGRPRAAPSAAPRTPSCPGSCTPCCGCWSPHGAIEDPWGDALDALRAEGPAGAGTVARAEALDETARAALGAVVTRHATHLTDLMPRLAPGWMPRTDDRVAIPLAGGRVALHGVFDLLVGVPQPGTAVAVRARPVDGGVVGPGAPLAALSRPPRDPAQRDTAVPAGPARNGQRPLRHRGRARGAPARHRVASRGLAGGPGGRRCGRRAGGRWVRG